MRVFTTMSPHASQEDYVTHNTLESNLCMSDSRLDKKDTDNNLS